jgi:hypothetical protein
MQSFNLFANCVAIDFMKRFNTNSNFYATCLYVFLTLMVYFNFLFFVFPLSHGLDQDIMMFLFHFVIASFGYSVIRFLFFKKEGSREAFQHDIEIGGNDLEGVPMQEEP